MKVGTCTKQPGERESYSITYEDALNTGDAVLTAVLKSLAPVGLAIDQITVVSPRVKFWISLGTDKTNYRATFTVTTKDGRVFEDEVTIKVKEE